VLSFGPFNLFAAERLLKETDEPVPLGGRALDILIALTQRAGEVVSHKELISSVWPDLTVEGANLRVHIAALRKALGDGIDGARYISNVVGRGYCFVAPVTRSTSSSINAASPCGSMAVPTRLHDTGMRSDFVRCMSAPQD
jgi:DNA-binding winged helix-turn-helix (wHTH) protein